jgi:hypothetical protein
MASALDHTSSTLSSGLAASQALSGVALKTPGAKASQFDIACRDGLVSGWLHTTTQDYGKNDDTLNSPVEELL